MNTLYQENTVADYKKEVAARNSKADKRALAMNCADKNINNIDPTYRGKVEINGETLDVINACNFNGVLHFGICGPVDPVNGSVVGWVPACLCNIPDVK